MPRQPGIRRNRDYLVINVDVVRSREIRRRQVFQSKMKEMIKTINRRHSRTLLVPFALTVGDEYQGVACSPEGLGAMFLQWEVLLAPVQFRFGVGVGRIETPCTRYSRAMDGEAFRRAREAIKTAKTKKRRTVFCGQENSLNTIVNAILLLLELLQKQWKRRDKRRCWLYRSSRSLGRVARLEGTSRAVINKTLLACHYSEIIEAERSLEELIEGSFSLVPAEEMT